MSDELLARHREVMPSWLALYYEDPMEIVDGEGRHVTDGDGNRYLDFFGGILTTMTGYAVPEVVEAIQAQAAKMLHTSTLYLIEPMVALAEKIAGLSDIDGVKVFFTTSGTEANDAALLLATSYRRSNQILAMRNSYHGRSFSTMAITGNRSWSSSSLSGLSVNYVHGGYRLRSPFRELPDAEYTAACVQDLRDVIDMCTAGDVACLIAEPIQGVGGFTVPPDGFFGEFKKVLDESGILFVADEVQTGWGRTGEHFWGYQAHGVVPDMVTFAKGVGNGLPLAGVIARPDVMDCLGANSISTFGGNPLVAAGGLANLEYLLSHDLQANAHKTGNRLREGLEPLVERTDWIAEVRGRGLMQAFECVEVGGTTPDAARAGALLEATRRHGLLIGKGGLYGNVLRIAPPLSVTEDEVDTAVNIIATSIEEIS
ncbi:MAG: aspartate aminotransferase family protein [Acidimicrobiales bacterium]